MNKYSKQIERVRNLRDRISWIYLDIAEQEAILGVLLKDWRKRKGFTLRELGRKLDCSHVHIDDMERGHRRPSPEMLIKLKKLLSE